MKTHRRLYSVVHAHNNNINVYMHDTIKKEKFSEIISHQQRQKKGTIPIDLRQMFGLQVGPPSFPSLSLSLSLSHVSCLHAFLNVKLVYKEART
jgi:hypothetical protein